MLQQMRSARFVIVVWSLIALAFVGGFLLVETSGLLGRSPLTATSAVAVVNGTEIRYQDFLQRSQQDVQQAQRQAGRNLTQDEVRRVENNTFNQMVMDVLLQQEYARRRIGVSNDELRDYARFAPPSWIMGEPLLQTEGRFDPVKYQRYLASPSARQSGLLVALEQYYRGELPRQKLLDQISSGVYVSDAELWRIWQDQHDSAQVSFVSFGGTAPDSSTLKGISDSELKDYFDKHKEQFRRQGRAVLSVVMIPRVITAADTAAARERASALRAEITGGAKFEDVAKRESADTVSGAAGGDLGKGVDSRFIPEFSKAARALKVGEISQPVLTQFGYHLIRVDDRKGDTTGLHHILVRIQQSDSSASRVDRRADSLANIASNAEVGSRLDSASKVLGLPIMRVTAFEDEPAMAGGVLIPSVSAWAFGGPHAGETSELFDDDNGYYLARLDSLYQGGDPNFDAVKNEVRAAVATQKQLDKLMPTAQQVTKTARTSTLETAAQQAGKQVEHTGLFTRGSLVPGIGQFNQAIGASFGQPLGQVGEPVRTPEKIFVIRVDKRVTGDSTQFEAQKPVLRLQRLQQLREQRVQMYLQDLRESATVKDRRKEINAAARRQS